MDASTEFAKFEAKQLEERINKLPKDKVAKAYIETDKELPMYRPDEIITAYMANTRQSYRLAILKHKLYMIEKEIKMNQNEVNK